MVFVFWTGTHATKMTTRQHTNTRQICTGGQWLRLCRSTAALLGMVLLLGNILTAQAAGMIVTDVQTSVSTQQQPVATQSDGNSMRVAASAACPSNSYEIISQPPKDSKFCVCESTYFNVGSGLCVGHATENNCTKWVCASRSLSLCLSAFPVHPMCTIALLLLCAAVCCVRA